MRYYVLVSFLAILAYGQPPAPITREQAVSETLGRDIERRDPRINNPPLNEYLQRIGNRIALTAGAKPLNVRVTSSRLQTAWLLPNGVLYVSAGLLERMESEAELAGLLAHELAHGPWYSPQGGTIPLRLPPCVLASQVTPGGDDRRELESHATVAGVATLKAAGYDPEALLNLLLRLSGEQRAWKRAIASDDLSELRAALQTDTPPAGGYLIDNSEFVQQQARLATLLENVAK